MNDTSLTQDSSSLAERGEGSHQSGELSRHDRITTAKFVAGSVFSIDLPFPNAIKDAVEPKYRDEDSNNELSTLRYTAITSDPNDFTLKGGYNLRPRMYNRHTEHLVCVTYYNEGRRLLTRTLTSLFQNIREVHNLKESTFWGNGGPAWQKMVVCIVMDGREHCDKAVLDILAVMGAFQYNVCKEHVHGVATSAHLFECTTQIVVSGDNQLVFPTDYMNTNIPPVQFMVCLKQLNPKLVTNIDTGTYLKPQALLRLWDAFHYDKNLGGACGAIQVDLGNSFCQATRRLLNPIVATQHFEYQVAVQLDRAMEASTGYLSVLPGAFSGYRHILGSDAPSDVYTLNRFLSDDRILTSEIVAKRQKKWHTTLVSDAKAYTDVPTNITDFINQRRRWLNGAFAATIYSLRMFLRLPTSGHNILRSVALLMQLLHNILAFILAWFSLSGFLLTTFIVNDISGNPPKNFVVSGFPFGSATPIINAVIQVIYISTLVFQFILALGSRPKHEVVSYVVSFCIFAGVQAYLTMNLVYLMWRLIEFKISADGGTNYGFINEYFSDVGWVTILVTGVSIFGVYIATGILALSPWHLLTSWAQYLFISSSYTNILNIYAFSNWYRYRKERNTDDTEAKFMKFRNRLVGTYIFSNFLVCIFVLDQTFQGFYKLGDPYWHKVWFFRIWMWANSGLFLFKFVGMVWYRVHGLLRVPFHRR
ncbi:chitin synthase-domain-containing protein [Mariannaea sp. PMI_226]|nr:chitin synthase-domain-containing protein [Mariannaea sp. PMI_226]